VLDFLTGLFSLGLGYSAINTARSAISAVVQTDGDKKMGEHPLICRFVRGVFQLRTPLPRQKNTWDVTVLLDFFRNSKNNSKLSLKELTLKLCALLLMVSAQRVQTIHLLKLSCVQFLNQGSCKIHVIDKLKHSRPGYHQAPIHLPKYEEEPQLCVVSCLKEYIARTAVVRGDSDKLILCYGRPHGPASKDSIARWMKDVLVSAGVQGFTAHSFRSASSSAMLKTGVCIDDILKSAGWSNAKTFQRFYNRPTVDDSQRAESQKVQSTMWKFMGRSSSTK